ncbi:MAG: hypothetical protein PHE58_03535 [Candidatus Omnitrophica bacterium]|nr:hypothetical protein [Candidatus Omnitrophota bacterium]
MAKKLLLLSVIMVSCCFLDGCAIFDIAGTLVSGTFNLVNSLAGAAINTASQMPMPPPGVFF